MTHKVQCPVPGCENVKEAESEEQAIKRMCGHISGKKDEAHSGFNRDQMREAIRSGSSLTSDGTSGSTEPPESTSGEGGTSDEGLGMPGSTESQSGGSGGSGVPSCPNCGEPLAEPSELKEMGQFKCAGCGHGPMRWTDG